MRYQVAVDSSSSESLEGMARVAWDHAPLVVERGHREMLYGFLAGRLRVLSREALRKYAQLNYGRRRTGEALMRLATGGRWAP